MKDRLQIFADWLIEYIDEPLPRKLMQVAEGGSAAEAVSIGHSFALTAVAGALKGILEATRTRRAPQSDEEEQDLAFSALFGSVLCFREAGAGGSNPLTPTNEINNIKEVCGASHDANHRERTGNIPTLLHHGHTK